MEPFADEVGLILLFFFENWLLDKYALWQEMIVADLLTRHTLYVTRVCGFFWSKMDFFATDVLPYTLTLGLAWQQQQGKQKEQKQTQVSQFSRPAIILF